MIQYRLCISIWLLISLLILWYPSMSSAIQDDLLNKAFKKSFEHEFQIDLWNARSATTVGNEVFKSSVGIALDLQNIGNDPKVCLVNGKPIITDMAKEICNTQYSGTFTDDFMCIKNDLNIPLATPLCLSTNPNYDSHACDTQRQSTCSNQWWQYIPPPAGTCHQRNILQWSIWNGEMPVQHADNEESCLNPWFGESLVVSDRRWSQPWHCVLHDGSIKTITDTDKQTSCQALWWTYEEPNRIDLTKTDPLIIRIIKFFIRMTVLLWVSVFIYIGITYILSSSGNDSLYDSEKVHLLIQIWAGILIALASLTILYLILSITGSGSDIVQDLSG